MGDKLIDIVASSGVFCSVERAADTASFISLQFLFKIMKNTLTSEAVSSVEVLVGYESV